MNKKVSETVKINQEVLSITSAAGSSSLNYDMQSFDKANLSVCIQGGAFSTATIDLMESSVATVAGGGSSAAGGSVGIVVGGASTLIPVTGGVRKMTITPTSATTSNEAFTVSLGTSTRKFAYTTSTANLNSSAWVSTLSYFGSTVGSTVNTGVALSMDALKTAINSTINFGGDVICSTLSTGSLTLTVADNAVGSLGFNTTYAVYTADVLQAVGAFDIDADDLTSTANKRYVGVKISSAATSCNCGLTVIRSGGRYMPPTTFAGKLGT